MPAAFNQKSFSSVVSQVFLFIAPFHLVPFHTLHTHTQALHGEQYVEIKQPLPTSGNVLNVPSLLYLCPVPSSYIIVLYAGPVPSSCMWDYCMYRSSAIVFSLPGTLYSEGKVVDVVDKKSGALVLANGRCSTITTILWL